MEENNEKNVKEEKTLAQQHKVLSPKKKYHTAADLVLNLIKEYPEKGADESQEEYNQRFEEAYRESLEAFAVNYAYLYLNESNIKNKSELGIEVTENNVINIYKNNEIIIDIPIDEQMLKRAKENKVNSFANMVRMGSDIGTELEIKAKNYQTKKTKEANANGFQVTNDEDALSIKEAIKLSTNKIMKSVSDEGLVEDLNEDEITEYEINNARRNAYINNFVGFMDKKFKLPKIDKDGNMIRTADDELALKNYVVQNFLDTFPRLSEQSYEVENAMIVEASDEVGNTYSKMDLVVLMNKDLIKQENSLAFKYNMDGTLKDIDELVAERDLFILRKGQDNRYDKSKPEYKAMIDDIRSSYAYLMLERLERNHTKEEVINLRRRLGDDEFINELESIVELKSQIASENYKINTKFKEFSEKNEKTILFGLTPDMKEGFLKCRNAIYGDIEQREKELEEMEERFALIQEIKDEVENTKGRYPKYTPAEKEKLDEERRQRREEFLKNVGSFVKGAFAKLKEKIAKSFETPEGEEEPDYDPQDENRDIDDEDEINDNDNNDDDDKNKTIDDDEKDKGDDDKKKNKKTKTTDDSEHTIDDEDDTEDDNTSEDDDKNKTVDDDDEKKKDKEKKNKTTDDSEHTIDDDDDDKEVDDEEEIEEGENTEENENNNKTVDDNEPVYVEPEPPFAKPYTVVTDVPEKHEEEIEDNTIDDETDTNTENNDTNTDDNKTVDDENVLDDENKTQNDPNDVKVRIFINGEELVEEKETEDVVVDTDTEGKTTEHNASTGEKKTKTVDKEAIKQRLEAEKKINDNFTHKEDVKQLKNYSDGIVKVMRETEYADLDAREAEVKKRIDEALMRQYNRGEIDEEQYNKQYDKLIAHSNEKKKALVDAFDKRVNEALTTFREKYDAYMLENEGSRTDMISELTTTLKTSLTTKLDKKKELDLIKKGIKRYREDKSIQRNLNEVDKLIKKDNLEKGKEGKENYGNPSI